LPYLKTGEGGGKEMKRTILSILVAGLFLTITASAAFGAAPAPKADKDKVLSVVIGEDKKELTKEIITAEQTDIENFLAEMQAFKSWIENARPFKDFIITDEEKTEIMAKVEGLLATLNVLLEENDVDPISPTWLYNEMFETEPGRSTIISVGMGWAFIPFYDYETFLGVMLRPMWLLYPPIFMLGGGYTGNLNINFLPPRIEYGDRLGCHLVRTTIFTGLYMNIGELGYDRMFGPGFMIMLGRARVVM